MYIALGYKKEAIIRYFMDLHYYSSDLTINTGDGSITVHDRRREPDWIVHLIDTGLSTDTGGRIKRLAPYIGNSTFMLTWCDGLSDVNLANSPCISSIPWQACHRNHHSCAGPFRLSRTRSRARDGFREKPTEGDGWINGAFFVLEPGAFEYIRDDTTSWERGPMKQLAADGQLAAYRHNSFWQCMDTLREKRLLEELWTEGRAPWKRWE